MASRKQIKSGISAVTAPGCRPPRIRRLEVRWWHFGFACVIYNLWLLVDFLTQERIGVIETRKKPRITLARFLGFLEKELVTLI